MPPGERPAVPHSIDLRVPVPPRSLGQLVGEAVLVVPQLFVLLARLLADPRVQLRRKLVVIAATAYLASPIDLVPDFIPIVGQVDDAVIVAFSVHHLLSGVPEELRGDYWLGSQDTLDLVEALVAWGAEMVPGPLRRLVGGSHA